MKDLIKAVLIGAALIAGFLLIPVILAVLLPIAVFAAVVGIIWILIKVISGDSDDKPP